MKTDLITITDGKPVTTSLKVADVFGKQHKDVLRAIRELEVPEDFNERNFAPVEYTDAKGEKRPMYYITRDGFTLLAMGFTGKNAMEFKIAYIEAFNEMETRLRNGTDPVVRKFVEEVQKKASAQVRRDLAAARNAAITSLQNAGYSVDLELIKSFTLEDCESNPAMQKQQQNKIIKQIVDPRFIATVKMEIESKEN